jgi:DNA mismatch repair ATPase MutS
MDNLDQASLTKAIIRRFTLIYKSFVAISIVGAVAIIALANYYDPGYLNGLYFLFIPVASAIYAYVRLKFFKKLLQIQVSWGREEKRKRDFSVIRKLNDATGPVDYAYRVDDQTWQDLHFDLLYTQIDRTLTVPGEAFLYRLLRTPLLDEKNLKTRDALIKVFQEDVNFREKSRMIFHQEGRERFGEITSLLWDEIPPVKPYHHLYTILGYASYLSLVTPVFIGYNSIVVILVIFAVNSYVHYRENRKYSNFLPAITQLGVLLGTAKKIVNIEHAALSSYKVDLKKVLSKTRLIARNTQFLFQKAVTSDTDIVLEYIKIFFLLEVRSFYRTIKEVQLRIEPLRTIYNIVGELDAAQAIASYREGLPHYTKPRLINGSAELRIDRGYHPLIEEAVTNSIMIKDKGVLITGSNMSGKSTFLRTIGVNVILAQTIYTCFADNYEAGFLRVSSSISKSDDLTLGKSFYYMEAERLLKLIQSADFDIPSILIIDELLSGTNYIERLAASEAILEYLIKQNCLVVVATHDLDLAGKLFHTYQCYHFTDRVTEEGLNFDYKLREGITRTRNAIKLLNYLNYPQRIVEKATSNIADFVDKDLEDSL